MFNVTVMMSTYNGQRYLREQINSILGQKGVGIKLFVRDDGSTDNTVEILKEYANLGKLEYYSAENVGPCRSFIDLLFRSPTSDFYAFSDQDDVWDEDKLIEAIKKIEKSKKEAFYHCIAGVVDENLNPISFAPVIPVETFPGSLLTSATGCTIVFNQKMMNTLRRYRPDCTKVSMHDVWVYRVAYAIGADVIYDNTSHMKYRQHASNYTGGVINFKEKLKRMLFTRTNTRSKTCEEVVNGYGEVMSSHNLKEAKKLAYYRSSIWAKLNLFFDREIRTNYPKTNVQIKVLTLLGKL